MQNGEQPGALCGNRRIFSRSVFSGAQGAWRAWDLTAMSRSLVILDNGAHTAKVGVAGKNQQPMYRHAFFTGIHAFADLVSQNHPECSCAIQGRQKGLFWPRNSTVQGLFLVALPPTLWEGWHCIIKAKYWSSSSSNSRDISSIGMRRKLSGTVSFQKKFSRWECFTDPHFHSWPEHSLTGRHDTVLPFDYRTLLQPTQHSGHLWSADIWGIRIQLLLSMYSWAFFHMSNVKQT